MSRILFWLLILLGLGACQAGRQDQEYLPHYTKAPPGGEREYVFGVHPLHNPERLYEMFGPIMDYLAERIPGSHFRLEASRNYAAFEEKLYGREFDFALPNPYQTVLALSHGYRVFGKMADDENFRGIILLRKDSPVKAVADLKGKAVSFPAPTALAATLLPQFFLHTHGLDVSRDIELRYVGSQESSIMNVYLGNVAAGATWPPPWRAYIREHPEVGAAVRVMWETESLPNNSLMARDDIPQDLVATVKGLLVEMHGTEQGRLNLERMALSRFESADGDTYVPVREFLDRFERAVRPLGRP
ncbi:phosphate/phosphite/phosphonate ABC transporter substrate-binding protein [Methylococcus sp. EFPC2]|uniref:phosphate/phosphite/phosphonate ABC transporter substrate-binding protein n=1 Tax=Methylococcus sp. EFPC2 TaxID=2812648 RepID=UPI0019677753|nr:phosphate/phosphite/phosphonate ABC transporter substrate-binding protein [Methylococcus sp. EFPC2]QSA96572.1 phosphate/phosphite/phosphonate ABC transporter substrate-binding protein [Methylococcus sp. EFPC2]